jgi:hypothetical protein
MKTKELCLKQVPLWDQDEDGTWITVEIGATYVEPNAKGRPPIKGVVTRIVPCEGDPERSKDIPPEYRSWADIYVTITPEN